MLENMVFTFCRSNLVRPSAFFAAALLLLCSCASTEKVELGTYIEPRGVSDENREAVSAELIEVFGPIDEAAEFLNPQFR